MTPNQHLIPRSVAGRLRPSPQSFAAAALYDPGLLLHLEADQEQRSAHPRVCGEEGRDCQPRRTGRGVRVVR